MFKLKLRLKALFFVAFIGASIGNLGAQEDSTQTRQFFAGSSLFVLGNLFPESPHFVQLDFGWQVKEKDALKLQAITWKYLAPLGIPWGPEFDDNQFNYPGYVRAFGLGLDYQRFLHKQWFGSVQATPFYQSYHAENGDKLGQGFQLFMQGRVGYQFLFFKNRMYLEPSIVFNWWPVNTHLPQEFQTEEDKWPSYFLFEPGMNFGINFN